MLTISRLQARFEDTSILKGVDLAINPGELHVILGPNGSGKSTLGKVLLNHPHYEKTAGEMIFEGANLDELETHERAQLGIFLAHQSPPAVTGVSAQDLLRAAVKAKAEANEEKAENIIKFKKRVQGNLQKMHLSEDFAKRNMNEGASGGERRKMEIVSLLTLGAKLAFLDEIDSGIDVDALKAIIEGIHEFLKSGETSIVLITHQRAILEHLTPTKVHIFHDGRIVESGGGSWRSGFIVRGFKSLLNSPLR